MQEGYEDGPISVAQVPASTAKLRKQMFGTRSVSGEASALVGLDVRSTAATVLRATATASCIRVRSERNDEALEVARRRCDEVAASFFSVADGLPDIAGPLRVVLLGRTQAGKSTLANYLSGSRRSVVGTGGQRTTRRSIAEPLSGRPDVLIVDTPGVGALDGAADRETAMAEARTADLVVWVGANNALQEQTADALRQVADWGVPLVLAWNCRAILDTPAGLAEFLDYPEDTFDSLDGHERRARAILAPFGQRPRASLALHAGAALASLDERPEAAALLRTSRVEQLVSTIVAEADRRLHNRVVTVTDVARRALVDASRTGQRLDAELRDTEDTRRLASNDFSKRSENTMREAERRFRTGLDQVFDQLRGWEDNHYKRSHKNLQVEWAQTEEEVRKDLDEHLRVSGEALRHDLVAVADDVAAGWEARFDLIHARHGPGPKEWGPPWVDNAIRFAIPLASAAVISGVSMLFPDATKQVTELVKEAEAGLLKKLDFRRRRFQRRATLQRQITAIRNEMAKEAVGNWATGCKPIRDELTRRVDAEVAAAVSAHDAAASARRLTQQAERSIVAVDQVLVRALLRLEGCVRAANHVERVRRRPGLAATVSFRDDTSLDELLLWPVQFSPEAIRPIPNATTPTDRVAYALDLGRRGGMVLPTSDGFEVIVDDSLPGEFLDAEAAWISAATGAHVTVRPIMRAM